MAETIKKYLDYEGLQNYDAKIKALIDNKEDSGVAATKANEALESAKAYTNTEVGNVQTAVDNLDAYVGDIPLGAKATTVVGYITEKTTGIATDAALEELQRAVDTIEADYLKAADETALEAKITAEAKAREDADSALDTRLAKTEAFFETADGESLDAALDTLVEIQTYIKTEGAAADEMVKDIAANTKAISDEVARATGAESALSGRIGALEAINHDAYVAADTALKNELTTEIGKKADQTTVDNMDTAYKAADTVLSGRIKTLEDKFGDGTDTVASQIATAKQEAIEDAAADATTKANAAETNANNHANSLNAAMNTRVAALEADTHTHTNKALLDTYTQTEVNLADAVAKKHAHDNATTLADITDTKVEEWDKVGDKADKTALAAEVNRATAAEEANAAKIAAFTAITPDEINAMFVVAPEESV